jgi:DNA cross-link repair 1B protein
MFLFMGYFGTVLYTGDMRWHRRLLATNHHLFSPTGELKVHVDEVILDNTFCDPIFSFPSQVSSSGTVRRDH